MNMRKWMLLLVALAMIGGTAAALNRLRTGLRLGLPGINTAPIPGSPRLAISLPEHVLNYASTNIPTDPGILEGLPHDTSFAQRRYIGHGDEFDQLQMLVVLMGTDRTSIHKPQFCLQGVGWDFDDHDSRPDTVRVQSPHPYDLPVTKMMMTRPEIMNGQATTISGIYVYWFVADNRLVGRLQTLKGFWDSNVRLLTTGKQDRWAYVGCLGICRKGDEDATYERMKQFIAACVPGFQKTSGPVVAGGAPEQTASR
jgi:hypothetical protein